MKTYEETIETIAEAAYQSYSENALATAVGKAGVVSYIYEIEYEVVTKAIKKAYNAKVKAGNAAIEARAKALNWGEINRAARAAK